ncbi:MAG: hypothetical protein U0936_04245 [Planctomycetaceae bacterium]
MITPSVLLYPSEVAERYFGLDLEDYNANANDAAPLSEDVLLKLPQANYVGLAGCSDPDQLFGYDGADAFVHRHHTSFRDLKKGLSHVAVISERTARKLPSTWLGFHLLGEVDPGRVLGFHLFGLNMATLDECKLDSQHPGCLQVLNPDGHVQLT